MAMVFPALLVWLALVQTATAGRVKKAGGGCPLKKMACGQVQDFLEVQQANGNCRPMDPRFITCEVGLMPAKNAWRWSTPDFDTEEEGTRCMKRYQPRECKYTNDRYVKDGFKLNLRAISTAGGACTDPKLDVRDCEKLMTTLASHDAAKKHAQGDASSWLQVAELTKTIKYLQDKGPNEYYWLPAFGSSMEQLSAEVLKVLMNDRSDATMKPLVEPFKSLLTYCVGAKARAVAINSELEYDKVSEEEAIETGLAECKRVTQIDTLFASHPWRKDLETDVNTITHLHYYEGMDILWLENDLWQELLNLASPEERKHMEDSLQKLQQKFGELIVNAGDRGETELLLAINFATLKFAAGAQPEGGQTRYDMIRAFRYLKNYLATVGGGGKSDSWSAVTLEAAIEDMGTRAQEGGMKWIDQQDYMKVLVGSVELLESLKKVPDKLPARKPTRTTTTTIATTTTTTTTTETTTITETLPEEDVQADAEEDGDSYAWVWHSVETMWQEKADAQPFSTKRSSVIAVPMV